MSVSHSRSIFKMERSLAMSLCESIGSPRALCVYLLLKYEEYDQYLDLPFDPTRYVTSSACRDDYLVTDVLRKCPRIPCSSNPEEEARKRFFEAEAYCKDTNSRLSDLSKALLSADADVARVVLNAQRYINKILGPLTRDKLDFVEQKMRFGPGATTSLSGVVTQGRKYMKRPYDATPRILDFRTFCFPQSLRGGRDICLRRSSKLRIVPKTAKVGRAICIEPDLNIFVQLGIGALVRERLLRFGLDLNTQELNQDLARKASLDDSLCTMDLSSASDTISREVVWALLPFEWCDLLHFARVDFVETEPGVEVSLNKWSSMGNGYTFELESLIFYGILLGSCEDFGYGFDNIVAYGDDLIFPTEFESVIRRTLDFLGFRVNVRKTYGNGPFRESCGTDWFRGVNVRPFYFRGDHYDFVQACYLQANAIRRWAGRDENRDPSCDIRCLPAWLKCLTAVEPRLRLRIPSGFDDSAGFISNWDEARPRLVLSGRQGWGGINFLYRKTSALEARIDDEGAYLYALHRGDTQFRKGFEALRGRFEKPRTNLGYVLTWPNLGPWI